MRWEAWVLVAVHVSSVLFTVADIGKARKPLTPATAVATLVVGGFLVWLAMRLGGAL